MNKYLNFYANSFIFIVLFNWGAAVNAQYIEEFPAMCSEATDRHPLPGHIIRLGFVRWTHYGWSFFFPDERIRDNLQRVSMAQNAGIIAQDPYQDLTHLVKMETPPGSFVVAQIFVGDENIEPVASCISQPILLERYSPSYYGSDWHWLDRAQFNRWSSFKGYSNWKWKRYWRDDFYHIRSRFKHHRFEGRDRKFKWRDRHDRRDHRDDRRFRRDRDGDDRRRDIIRDRDRDDRRGRGIRDIVIDRQRDIKLPIQKEEQPRRRLTRDIDRGPEARTKEQGFRKRSLQAKKPIGGGQTDQDGKRERARDRD